MYFLHFSTVTVSPKPNYSSNQFFLCFRLYLPTIKFFEFMPHVLDWIEVRGLCWCSPPVDSILSEILYCISRGTFVCLGSLSCIKRCVSGNFSSINGSKVSCSKVSSMMSQNKNRSMIPSNTQMPVLPLLLIPAQTWTFTGCFGLMK